MSLYKKIFSQALKMTWHNPFFWIFGFLTIFFGGTIEIEALGNFSTNPYVGMSDASNSIFGLGFWSNLPKAISHDVGGFGVLVGAFLLMLLFLAIIVLLASIGQIFIVNRFFNLSRNNKFKDEDKKTFRQVLLDHKDQMVGVSLVNIFYKAAVYLVFILVSLPIFLTANEPSLLSDALFMVSFIVLLPLAIIVAMIAKFAVSYIAVQKISIKEAINKAFVLFKANWLVSTEVSFILFIVSILGSLLVIFALYALAIPLSVVAVYSSILISKSLFVPLMAVSKLLIMLSFFLGVAFLYTYYTAVWTGLFEEMLNNGQGKGKINSFLSRFSPNK